MALLAAAGCSDSTEAGVDAGPVPTLCGSGLDAADPNCVLIFDTCKEGEIPLLGGGCQRVGVTQCLGGWGVAGPPAWKCKPIGPPQACLPGWTKVKGGWCEPILPASACPAGTMEVLGQSACQPIGDCGTGTWGKIKTVANTIYVNQNHRGGGAGTKANPYKTITDALAKAAPGDHIAVAAGTYQEDLTILRKVTLEGRCAQQVTIKGAGPGAAVEAKSWATGAVLRGLTITGAGKGVRLDGVDVTLERVAVKGCGARGAEVGNKGTMTFRHSLVAGNRELGIGMWGAKTVLERSVVRDTEGYKSNGTFGTGIQAGVSSITGQPSDLKLLHSLVMGNRTHGLVMYRSTGQVSGSVISSTRKDGNGKYGDGVAVLDKSTLDIQDALVEGNARAGIVFENSGGSVRRSLVRRNIFAIDLESGAAPFIGPNNRMTDSTTNKVTTGQGLTMAPKPKPPNISGL